MSAPLKIRRVPIGRLRPDPNNEMDHSDPKHRATLKASLEKFGQVEPLVVRAGTDMLIGGHGRLELMRELGFVEVDVVDFDGTDEEVDALRVVLNRSAELSSWKPEALHKTLLSLKERNFDIGKIGFTPIDFKAIAVRTHARNVAGANDPGAGAVPKTPVSKPGELFQLGPHRLLCGDSRKKESFEAVLGDERIGITCTDPPYGVDYEGAAGKIENDNLSEADLQALLEDVFAQVKDRSRPGAAVYVAAPSGPLFHVFGSVLKPLGIWRQTVCWNKNAIVLGRSDYQWKHESIFYGWVPGAAHTWNGGRSQGTVLDFDKPTRNEEHPTMKPVPLYERLIANSARPDDIVFEPFGGSGTTLIAAARLGFSCRSIELDPRFCDVIRRRWTTWAKAAGEDPGPGALE